MPRVSILPARHRWQQEKGLSDEASVEGVI